MKKKNTKNKISKRKIAAVGAGVAAVGAGAYYLLGPNGKKHQKKVSVLMKKMKREVMSEMKKAKTVSVPFYHKTVDVVAANYAKQYELHEKDLKHIIKKLKSELGEVEKLAKKTAKKSAQRAKKKI